MKKRIFESILDSEEEVCLVDMEQEVYMESYKEKRDDVKFYLCGWSKMIDETVANLFTKLHYDRSQIIYELYG